MAAVDPWILAQRLCVHHQVERRLQAVTVAHGLDEGLERAQALLIPD